MAKAFLALRPGAMQPMGDADVRLWRFETLHPGIRLKPHDASPNSATFHTEVTLYTPAAWLIYHHPKDTHIIPDQDLIEH